MKNLLVCILAFLFIINPTVGELKFVIELFRHGARGPIYNFYDYQNQTYMAGELTPVGIRQHYDLGQKLKEEYIDNKKFIDPEFNHTQVYYRSTDLNRTLMSAISHLYGFFPIPTGPNLYKGLQPQLTLPPYKGIEYRDIGQAGAPFNYQPMPVHTVNDSEDSLLNPWSTCPNINNIIDQFYQNQSNLTQWFNQQFEQTYIQLANILNLSYVSRQQVSQIYDTFMCDIYENRPIPPMSTDLWTNITNIVNFNWYFEYGAIEEQRLMNTDIFNQIINYMDPIVNNTSVNGLKWVGWSAHDSNIAQVNAGLNFSSYQCNLDLIFNGTTQALNCLPRPFFASQLIFELHEKDNQYYVMIKYDGDYLKLCGQNSTNCSYSVFRQNLLNFVYPQDQFINLCYSTGQNNTLQINQQFVMFDKIQLDISNLYKEIIIFQIIVIIFLVSWIILKNKKQQPSLIESEHIAIISEQA